MVSTETGGIGIEDRLPWFQISIMGSGFEELATDQVLLVGRNSYESNKHLQGYTTYVYTTDETFEETDTVKRISGEAEDVLARIKQEHPDKNIIIGGGQTLYTKFYDLIDEWRITIIEEFVVFDRDINLTNIKYIWNKKRLVNSGQDLNMNFSTYHFTK
jgi:dihydrofolate reductase